MEPPLILSSCHIWVSAPSANWVYGRFSLDPLKQSKMCSNLQPGINVVSVYSGGKLAPLAADARKCVSFACQGATSLRTGRGADLHVTSDTFRSVVTTGAATFPFSSASTGRRRSFLIYLMWKYFISACAGCTFENPPVVKAGGFNWNGGLLRTASHISSGTSFQVTDLFAPHKRAKTAQNSWNIFLNLQWVPVRAHTPDRLPNYWIINNV